MAKPASETNTRVMRADFMGCLNVQSACRAEAGETEEISSLMLARRARARLRGSFHCCIPQGAARSRSPVAPITFLRSRLRVTARRIIFTNSEEGYLCVVSAHACAACRFRLRDGASRGSDRSPLLWRKLPGPFLGRRSRLLRDTELRRRLGSCCREA